MMPFVKRPAPLNSGAPPATFNPSLVPAPHSGGLQRTAPRQTRGWTSRASPWNEAPDGPPRR